MPENVPPQRDIDHEISRSERVLPPALNALGKLYAQTAIPLPYEYADQAESMLKDVFDQIHIGDPDYKERNDQIAREYFGLESRPASSKTLGKKFNITADRVNDIAKKFKVQIRRTANRNSEFSNLPYFLPFRTGIIGSDVFGENISQIEIKDKLPGNIKIKDLNLSETALENLRKYNDDNDADEDTLFTLLSRRSSTILPETNKELKEVFEKMGFKTNPLEE